MLYFLTTVSLVLNVLCFYLIAVLWQKQSGGGAALQDEQVKRELEDLLLAYASEMKEQNDEIMNLIKENCGTGPVKTEPAAENHIEDAENGNPAAATEDIQDAILHQDVLNYAESGYTADQIAKMLDRGKGEIELILKFHGAR